MHGVDSCDIRNITSSAICDIRDINLCVSRNNHGMQGEDEQFKAWLKEQLARAGRGAKTRLAEHLGMRPEAVSRMIGKHGEPRRISAGELSRIAEFFKATPPFLRRLPAGARSEARPVAEVPLVSWVSAGRMTETAATPSAEAVLSIPDLSPGDYMALSVRGDSMDRISPEGSIIVVNRRDRNPRRGKAYVFAMRGEATYKMWEPDPPRLEPFSTNPANKPVFINKKRGLFIIGRVIRTMLDL